VIPTTRRTRFTAPVALTMLLCVVSLSSSAALHDDADDPACNPVVVLHDHAAHRIIPDPFAADSDTGHCFICHWHSLRSVDAKVRFLTPSEDRCPIVGSAAARLAAAAIRPQSARAPPHA
jgi:hypothetical protein